MTEPSPFFTKDAKYALLSDEEYENPQDKAIDFKSLHHSTWSWWQTKFVLYGYIFVLHIALIVALVSIYIITKPQPTYKSYCRPIITDSHQKLTTRILAPATSSLKYETRKAYPKEGKHNIFAGLLLQRVKQLGIDCSNVGIVWKRNSKLPLSDSILLSC